MQAMALEVMLVFTEVPICVSPSTVLRLNNMLGLLSTPTQSLCQLDLTKGKHNRRFCQGNRVKSLCVFHRFSPLYIALDWLIP